MPRLEPKNSANPVALQIYEVGQEVAKKRSKPGESRLSSVDDRMQIRHINSAEEECDPMIPIGTYLTVQDETGKDLELFIGRGRGQLNGGSVGYYD